LLAVAGHWQARRLAQLMEKAEIVAPEGVGRLFDHLVF
jgi:hypothetical protein